MAEKLHALADQLGVTVMWRTRGPKGLWVPGRRVIVLREGMGWRKERSTLAHELGHAVHNDFPTRDPRLHARQENRANEFAVRLLITPEQLAEAEQVVGHHDGALALELGVTVHLIETTRRLHRKLVAA